MHVTAIVAMDRNRTIGGEGGGLPPWELLRDRDHFRAFTAGKHLLLGRVTYEEMRGWFTDHVPLVLTRSEDYEVPEGRTVGRVEEALTVAAEQGAEELCVIGGASIYENALPFVDELHLTRVETEVEGVKRFPDYLDGITWETVSEESHEADEDNTHAMTFLHLRRLHPCSLRPARMHWI